MQAIMMFMDKLQLRLNPADARILISALQNMAASDIWVNDTPQVEELLAHLKYRAVKFWGTRWDVNPPLSQVVGGGPPQAWDGETVRSNL